MHPDEKHIHESLGELIKVFAKIGILSFGGPAGQIALMHRVIVEEKEWLSEQQYLNALSFCILLPGPEAMQLATYVGWRLHGVIGGLTTGLLFVLPGAAIVLSLAVIYGIFGDVGLVAAVFLGVKAAVVIIVIEALLKVAKRALQNIEYWIIAILAFIGIFFLNLPYPVIIVAAALYGALRNQTTTKSVPLDDKIPLRKTLKTICLWLAIWLTPLIILSTIAPDNILTDIGLFFSKLAIVTFGGAYAVLAYMVQDVVNGFGWLSPGEMMDGLGLAETTPGPLILVTQFVGFLAAYGEHGLWFGLAGAMITLWATFTPCFLWIFAGAPYVEQIAAQPRLKGALSGITAAVVGVILNLSIWFALHVFFKQVTQAEFSWFTLWVPDFATLDWRVAVLSVLSAAMLLMLKQSVLITLATAAGFGIIISLY